MMIMNIIMMIMKILMIMILMMIIMIISLFQGVYVISLDAMLLQPSQKLKWVTNACKTYVNISQCSQFLWNWDYASAK